MYMRKTKHATGKKSLKRLGNKFRKSRKSSRGGKVLGRQVFGKTTGGDATQGDLDFAGVYANYKDEPISYLVYDDLTQKQNPIIIWLTSKGGTFNVWVQFLKSSKAPESKYESLFGTKIYSPSTYTTSKEKRDLVESFLDNLVRN